MLDIFDILEIQPLVKNWFHCLSVGGEPQEEEEEEEISKLRNRECIFNSIFPFNWRRKKKVL